MRHWQEALEKSVQGLFWVLFCNLKFKWYKNIKTIGIFDVSFLRQTKIDDVFSLRKLQHLQFDYFSCYPILDFGFRTTKK